MIKTDLPQYEKDLIEVIDLFSEASDVKIRHLFSHVDRKVVNTIVIDGKKSYAYGNLLPEFKDDIEEKRYIKRYAKLSLYKALSTFYNKSLPWGALTGIRPTKLAYQSIKDDGEFTDFFVNKMKVSEEKTHLVEKILEEQKGIYTEEDNLSDLFVFIPFCPSRCKYCSFISNDIKHAKELVNPYIDALIDEINDSSKYIKKLRSIYIGGGTPAILNVNDLERVLKNISKYNTGVEFTVEAGRPDVITQEKLDLFKKYNVTRICINPQTFNNKTLEKLNRTHTAEDIERVYNLAKNDFIINMDLIAGLEDETFEDFKYSLDKTLSLNPDNITVHTLCLKKGADLTTKIDNIECCDIEKMIDYAYKILTENGYNPYYLYRQKYMAGNLENVGYTKKGKSCIYNIDTMEEIADTVACGANAISKRVIKSENRIERYAPPKDVKAYLIKLDAIKIGKKQLFE